MNEESSNLNWQELKGLARALGLAWVDAKLREYTPESDSAGFSREKRRAALSMILFPHCLRLKGIAKLASTSDGVIRVWRTQENFWEAETDACFEFGDHLANTFERIIEGEDAVKGRHYLEIQGIPILTKKPLDLISFLPFFNPTVVFSIEELIRVKFHSGKRAYSVLALGFLELVYSYLVTVKDTEKVKAFKAWMRDPYAQSLTKIALTQLIDDLADPDCRKKYSEDEIKTLADTLKSNVFNFVKLLYWGQGGTEKWNKRFSSMKRP